MFINVLTHCDIVSAMAGQPLLIDIKTWFINLFNKRLPINVVL